MLRELADEKTVPTTRRPAPRKERASLVSEDMTRFASEDAYARATIRLPSDSGLRVGEVVAECVTVAIQELMLGGHLRRALCHSHPPARGENQKPLAVCRPPNRGSWSPRHLGRVRRGPTQRSKRVC
jgi:hypothetical protein